MTKEMLTHLRSGCRRNPVSGSSSSKMSLSASACTHQCNPLLTADTRRSGVDSYNGRNSCSRVGTSYNGMQHLSTVTLDAHESGDAGIRG